VCRVAWTKSSEDITKRGGASGAGSSKISSTPRGLECYGRPVNYPGGEEEGKADDDDGDDGDDSDNDTRVIKEVDEDDMEEDEEEDNELEELGMNTDKSNNRCDLLWQGVLPKKTFHAFRFQECRSAASARKVLEAKGVAHYWDMAMRADELLASGSISY
jgi:hypothetical protein